VRIALGTGLDLAQARRAAAELSRRYQSGDRDLREVVETERREAQRERETAEKEAEAAATKALATLGALLVAYVAQLRRDSKSSARAVETAFVRHVEKPWPRLWVKPAADISPDDLLSVVALVVDGGRLREAAKVRSYLRAAYSAAIRARQDARGLPALRDLRITSNPARDIATVDGAVQAGERALSVAELRAYWRHISAMPAPGGPLLRFHLLTGGQRIEQLARVSLDDIDHDARTIRLRDAKGRRRLPRLHDVPLIDAAVESINEMAPVRVGPYVWTCTNGSSGADYTSARNRLLAVVADMLEAGELPGGPFTLGDLRRTVETRLAAEGVSADVRAQLQSHGLGGVQSRHYDRHSYQSEKLLALQTLHRIATGWTATVTSIRASKRGV
jgi:integrase